MSEQQPSTSPTDTSEKAEFGGINLLIGFVIGAVLQFGWWALIDRLQLRSLAPGNIVFLAQILAVIDQSRSTGLLLGAVLGATNNSAHVPIRFVIWKSIRWAIGFSLVLYGLDVMRFVLQAALGESLGDIVASAIWFGLAGAFVGLVLELKRAVLPNVDSAPLSFRQIAQVVVALDRSSLSRVLVASLFGALLGITIEELLHGSSTWPLMLALTVAVAVVALVLWPPSRKTVRQWLSGALTLTIVVGLVVLVGLSVQLGVLAGIVVLVVYAVVQSRK
jgi:hypothetical protein